MKIAIKDANILIDLVEAALLDSWFALKIETMTTDFVMNEIDDERQIETLRPYIESGLLAVIEFGAMDVGRTAALHAKAPSGITFEDCSVLRLAVKEKATLMTGDGLLRTYAVSSGVSVKGTLWILDRMVDRGILDAHIAAEKLSLLLKMDRRLPAEECEQRLFQWGSKPKETKK